MEYSSKFSGAAEEECQSSESGWTTYIGSHINDSYDDGYPEHDDVGHGHGHGGHENEDSDDSMVSDASSGPSQRHYLYENGEADNGITYLRHEEDNPDGNNYKKKAKKPVEEKKSERKSKENESFVKGAETSSHSISSKLRNKKLWLAFNSSATPSNNKSTLQNQEFDSDVTECEMDESEMATGLDF